MDELKNHITSLSLLEDVSATQLAEVIMCMHNVFIGNRYQEFNQAIFDDGLFISSKMRVHLLRLTFRHRDKLPTWYSFLEETRNLLDNENEDSKRILRGLKDGT